MTVNQVVLSNGHSAQVYKSGDFVDEVDVYNDGEFNLVYLDPPYRVGMEIMGDEKVDVLRNYMKEVIDWLYVATKKTVDGGHIYLSFSTEYLPYLYVLLRQPYLLADKWDVIDPSKLKYLDYYLRYRNTLIMRYANVKKSHPFGDYNYNFDYEPCLFFTKGLRSNKPAPLRKPHTQFSFNCVWDCRMPSAQKKVHPTEKPMDFYINMILRSSDIGQHVLDCFTGSGNLLIVCNALKRNAVGIDDDRAHFETYEASDKRRRISKVEQMIQSGQTRL